MQLIVDSSAAVEFLIGSPAGTEIMRAFRDVDSLHAPDLLVSEALSAIRSLANRKEIEVEAAEAMLTDLGRLPITLWPSLPLIHRAWSHRHQVSAYDAMFVALAEVLNGSLITCDQRLFSAVAQTNLPAICIDNDGRGMSVVNMS